jgi:hypothetical protein
MPEGRGKGRQPLNCLVQLRVVLSQTIPSAQDIAWWLEEHSALTINGARVNARAANAVFNFIAYSLVTATQG